MSKGFAESGQPVITTKEWNIRFKWQDGSTDWLTISQVKNSNHLQLAEYFMAHKIHKDPAFNWWVRKILPKRDQIINKVATCI